MTLSGKCDTGLCALFCITIASPDVAQIEAIYPCGIHHFELNHALCLQSAVER